MLDGMKRSHAFHLALAVILCAAWTRAASAQPADLRSVADPGGRFLISVPADWDVQVNPNGSPSILAAAPAAPDGIRLNVNVAVQGLRDPLSPEAVAKRSEAALRTVFHNFSIVQQGSAQIGGRPTYYRYFTWDTTTGVSVYAVQVYFTTGRTAFVVTGSMANEPERLQTDLPLIARIVDSFRLTEAPGAPTS